MSSSNGFEVKDGIWPVMHTPFGEDGSVEYHDLEKMVDFYIEAGVAGLFITGLSGEGLWLSDEERLGIADSVCRRAAGRIGIAAVANYAETLDRQIALGKKIKETGVDVVIFTLALLSSDQAIEEELLTLMDNVEGPLGIYECPKPVHRLIDLEVLKKIAGTGRYVFMKDTCKDISVIKERLSAVSGTALKIFPAQLGFLPEVMFSGSAGFCGTMANIFPEACARLIDRNTDEDTRKKLYSDLDAAKTCIQKSVWPSSCKYMLKRRGIVSTMVTRDGDVTEEELDKRLDASSCAGMKGVEELYNA